MDLIISTPEELRAFIPAHDYRNLDTIRGFLINSQNTFLRQRIGQPLLSSLLTHYGEMTEDGTYVAPIVSDSDPTEAENEPWRTLILLCQRVIVYDAFGRSADIRAVNDNDMGLNVAESANYDAANDKRIERYKLQMQREAHSAVDMLLVQLESWQALVPSTEGAPAPTEGDPSPTEPTDPTPAITTIVHLWQQSPTYYLNNGLLFNTATEFNLYVDIYESRDRFVTLLPDIRYCQELHLEAELSPELLSYLINAHKSGTLNAKEQKAYIMLQRTLSLYVEARAKMFSRADAKDEATGHMRLTLDYLRRNQTDFELSAIYHSPVFDYMLWPREQLREFFESNQMAIPADIRAYLDAVSISSPSAGSSSHASHLHSDPYCHEPGGPSCQQRHGMIKPSAPSCNAPCHCHHSGGYAGDGSGGRWPDGENHGFCETSLI